MGSQYVLYDQGYCLDNDIETLSAAPGARIVVTKKVSLTEYFSKDETPPETIYYSRYDEDYKTVMHGILSKGYQAYNFLYDKIEVVYEGTVSGTI